MNHALSPAVWFLLLLVAFKFLSPSHLTNCFPLVVVVEGARIGEARLRKPVSLK